MNNMGAQAVLAILLIIIGTMKADDGGVSFWREHFEMTCPENGSWFKTGSTEILSTGDTYRLLYNGTNKGLYHCKYKSEDSSDEKYYFYVQGKVCSNCFELDASLFGLVIFADVVGTVFVMMIIYRCTKKKSSPGPQSSKAPARSGGRAPPVPSPDYEQLNTHTRSQDTYSIVNRTG